jgi:hypothetical protein
MSLWSSTTQYRLDFRALAGAGGVCHHCGRTSNQPSSLGLRDAEACAVGIVRHPALGTRVVDTERARRRAWKDLITLATSWHAIERILGVGAARVGQTQLRKFPDAKLAESTIRIGFAIVREASIAAHAFPRTVPVAIVRIAIVRPIQAIIVGRAKLVVSVRARQRSA